MAKGYLLDFLLAGWAFMCISEVDGRTRADFHSASPTTSGRFNTDQTTSWEQEALFLPSNPAEHDDVSPHPANFLPSWTISSQLANKSDVSGVKAEIDQHRRHQRIGQSDITSVRSPGPKSISFSHQLLSSGIENSSSVERDDNRNSSTGQAPPDNFNRHVVELNNGWNKSEWSQSQQDLVLTWRTGDDHIVKFDDDYQGQASVRMEQEAVQLLTTSVLRIVSQLMTDSPLVSNLFQLIVVKSGLLADFIQILKTQSSINKESSHNQNQLETLETLGDVQVAAAAAASHIQKIFLEQLSPIISTWLIDPLVRAIPWKTDDDQVPSMEDTLSESLEIERVEGISPRGWTVLGPGPTKAVIAAGILIALAVYGRTWRYVIPNEYALEAITIPPELYPSNEGQNPLPTPGRRSLSSISTEQEPPAAMMIFDTAIPFTTAIPRLNLDKENDDEDLYAIYRTSWSSKYRSKVDQSSSTSPPLAPNLTHVGFPVQ